MYIYIHVPELCTCIFACSYMQVCCAVQLEYSLFWQEIIVLAETAKNETLICPLCKGVFRDPHIAACGVNPSNYSNT